jgi:hypothetical protein
MAPKILATLAPSMEGSGPGPQFLKAQSHGPDAGPQAHATIFSYVGVAATILPFAFSVQMSAACRTSMLPACR